MSGDVDAAREHRLALVMNGGVSLAVWMGGLARELDNVRRASTGLSGPPAAEAGSQGAAEDALFKLWQRHTANRRVVVDVVAGTSAGGLNGVLLAMAAACGSPLTGLRELWMSAAQISEEALLRPQTAGAASVLNGDYFLEQVRCALRKLAAGGRPEEEADVVLTVTSTALQGPARSLIDGYGGSFTEPDHRRRFEFRRVGNHVVYDPQRPVADRFTTTTRNDFTDVAALALGGRASASFPVAFAPVPESESLRGYRRWPKGRTEQPEQAGHAERPTLEWLADGGILDNSPFEPVLKAIADQPVEQSWRRTLCFVIPSASEAAADRHVGAPHTGDASLQPPWLSVALAAFGLPREADLRDDVEELHELVTAGRTSYDVERFLALLEPQADEGRRTARELATLAFPLYREARAASGVYQVRDVSASPDRFVSPPGEVVPSAVTSKRGWLWLPDELPTAVPATWHWGLVAAQRAVALLVRSIAREGDEANDLRRDLSALKSRVDAISTAVTDILAVSPLAAGAGPAEAATLVDDVFRQLSVQDALGGLVADAVRRYADARLPASDDDAPAAATEDPATRVLLAALCIEVVNGAGGLPVENKPGPVLDFMRMGLGRGPALFAREMATAEDKLRSNHVKVTGSDILYGSRLNHFGAFGRPSWREWDWLWGRIHGAVHIGRLLGLSDGDVDEIVRTILHAEGTTESAVSKGIGKVYAETTETLLKALRSDGALPPVADSVFTLLGSDLATSPELPARVKEIGRLASVVGARDTSPGLKIDVRGRALRLVAAPLRKAGWKRLR